MLDDNTQFILEMKFDLQSLIPRVQGLDELVTPFSTAEMDATVNNLPIDKAPGPDGFTTTFFHTFWDMLKMEVW